MKFEELRLAEPVLRAVVAEGYSLPTPIQTKAIPHVIEGRDLIGCAQTGTGKTAAFALPILHRLSQSNGKGGVQHGARHESTYGTTQGVAGVESARPQQSSTHDPSRRTGASQARAQAPESRHDARRQAGSARRGRQHQRRPIRCLVLSPTRELALQIAESFRAYGRFTGLRHTVVYGGVNQNPQTRALSDGVDILVATPGRLLDLVNQGFIDLAAVEVFVLDEADRMLDMGFIPDIRRVVAKLPAKRQSLFFSATMPTDIRRLADSILTHPVSVQVAATSAPADNVAQSVYFVAKQQKSSLLSHLLSNTATGRVLVFTRTKHGADRVARHLYRTGVRAEAIHGEKSQNARQRALENFRSNRTSVLVATDIAARGLDIDEISHVINYDMPNVPETYVHRIGRTARAGASGTAVSFCDHDERPHLKAIERLIRKAIAVHEADGVVAATADATPARREHSGTRATASRPSHMVSPPAGYPRPVANSAHSRPADRPVRSRGGDRHDPAQADGRQRFWGGRRRRRGQAKRVR
jgi:ATP-dependent RNA helicase RhlE